MIDFTSAKVKNKAYAGANGSKISVIYNEQYMLKFPLLTAAAVFIRKRTMN